MSTEPSKAYSPAAVEQRIYQQWLDAGVFHADPNDTEIDGKPPFSVVIPPPNVTGALHLGHAINNTLEDIVVRRKRMQGFNTMWMPGVDHAGIATQAVVEKGIFEKEKKSRHDLGREELVRRIWEWKEQYGSRIVTQLKLMGCSCDWQRERFTLDDGCAATVREWFFRLFKDGLIFRGKRLVNWDTHLQTAVADDEVYHETVKGHLWHIRYPVASDARARGEGTRGEINQAPREAGRDGPTILPPDAKLGTDYLVVATTRPETMLADTAVAVHPEDERYQYLIGKQVVLPLTGRTIPVIADGLLVKREFGTGCVKVTPGHDPNDYATYLRHPEIGIRNMMTPDGKVEKEYGKYASMKLEAARKEVVADLEAAGLIEKIEDYQNEVGHSDRSKTPIQPFLSDQWFVKMGDLTEEEAARIESPHLRATIDRASQSRDALQSPDRKGGVRATHEHNEPLPYGRGSENATRESEKSLLPGLAQMAIEAICEIDAHYESTQARHDCDKVHIFPRRYVNTYRDWLAEKRDWCISRQLWWGHRIPVWTGLLIFHQEPTAFRENKTRAEQEVDTLLESYFENCEVERDHFCIRIEFGTLISVCVRTQRALNALGELVNYLEMHRSLSSAPDIQVEGFPSATAAARKLQESKLLGALKLGDPFELDPDVLDTWFSSALWPLSTMGWPTNNLRDSEALPSPDREGGVRATLDHNEPLPYGRGSENQGSGNLDRESERRTRTSEHKNASSQDRPLAYLITFHTYGTWFRGSEKGSVDEDHNLPGTPFIDPNDKREDWEMNRMEGEPVLLDASRRPIVKATIEEVAKHRGWNIHGLNVRSNHVHVVICVDAKPEKVMNDLKSYSTRRMVEAGVFPSNTRAWSRHGSTRYLWDESSVESACRYVIEQQGEDLQSPDREGGVRATREHSEPLPHGRGSEKQGSEKQITEPHGSENETTTKTAPEPNLLNVFYPTAVLSTAREIITLWVARMVVAGLYNVGKVPFRDVVIHPVIMDGQGRQMKKSLGNGVDPVDIIDMYGADALRFTLAGMTTETQDVRVPVKKAKLPDGREVNTSEKFEVGRNFCNKLWQAATGYVLPNVADLTIEKRDGRHTAARAENMPLYDRWIRTRLIHCIEAVDKALDDYQFARAVDRIRDFFWTEFCDWYLEESKLRVHDLDANDVKVVLLQVLDITLCMLHPIAPFITEALWSEIGNKIPRHFELIAPDDFQGESRMLITAPWPTKQKDFQHKECERDVGDIIQPIITSLRQARTDINASRSKAGRPAVRTLPSAIVQADETVCAVIAANKDMIQRLGNIDPDGLTFGPSVTKPRAVRTDVKAAMQIYVPLGELVDLTVETKRLQDDLADKQAALDRAKGQLANEGFMSRATPQAVEESRQRAAELERQCGLIERHIADLA